MTKSIMAEISEQYRNTHENLLDLIVKPNRCTDWLDAYSG